MSNLSRAFTRRNKRPEVSAPMPYRGEGHTRLNSASIKRGNISGPVQLLSTTNMLAYNAPDINSASSSASSLRSDDAMSPQSYASSMTSPDASPHESFPIEANPLTSYFPKRSATVTSHPRSSTSSNEAPIVPQRALSHTKRSHQELARKRSVSRMSPPPLNAPRSTPTIRASQEFFQPEPHPFSKELEQVNEVAEEFGGLNLLDEEERVLHDKGLKKFSVEDYLVEVEELYGSIFDDDNRGSLYTSWF
ncbi:unnamed protein product [Penicillium salamii]|uniref:Uncharacterized protein n=1 Tax=Penicillium salamii TaxID=1612424 RepID=A0A9W4J8P8_9EURO|nr:unnamed protein product [Penicillium salamii]CAG7988794.1 unnamed protein product [Penicillium salamii]CAG8079942.1 unnamed protein product [Penicillium salamii]CAG8083529.1 unnamed protein product [Penicillium salamii]CAG8239463.1 unnamed protein product [Penicillium salamii]